MGISEKDTGYIIGGEYDRMVDYYIRVTKLYGVCSGIF